MCVGAWGCAVLQGCAGPWQAREQGWPGPTPAAVHVRRHKRKCVGAGGPASSERCVKAGPRLCLLRGCWHARTCQHCRRRSCAKSCTMSHVLRLCCDLCATIAPMPTGTRHPCHALACHPRPQAGNLFRPGGWSVYCSRAPRNVHCVGVLEVSPVPAYCKGAAS